MAEKISEDLRKKFSELTKKKYSDQAVWFMNGFWANGIDKEAETIWKYAQKFIEIDEKNKKEGNELDEFQAHKFLESLGETLTVVAMRDRLRQIDLDFNRRVALIEYLTVRYGKNVQQVVDAPQGDNTEKVKEAQSKLDAVQRAYEEVQRQLEEQEKALQAQKKALEESRKATEVARVALEEQKKAEEAVKKAEAESRAAVDELKRQEDAYHEQCSTLENKSKDSGASVVARNKAANELAQLKGEDPLPLRKAKISQEASLRKVEKERKAAEAATANAEGKARDAEQKQKESERKAEELEEQKRRVEEAVVETEAKVKEAMDFLEEVKRQGGVPHGAIWWMERELKEQQKYLPKSKQRQF